MRAFRAALPLPMLGLGSSTASNTASRLRSLFCCLINSSEGNSWGGVEGGGSGGRGQWRKGRGEESGWREGEWREGRVEGLEGGESGSRGEGGSRGRGSGRREVKGGGRVEGGRPETGKLRLARPSTITRLDRRTHPNCLFPCGTEAIQAITCACSCSHRFRPQ